MIFATRFKLESSVKENQKYENSGCFVSLFPSSISGKNHFQIKQFIELLFQFITGEY